MIQRQRDAIGVQRRDAIRIDAAIILAGALRASPLANQTMVSVLDLPICGDATVLESWLNRLDKLAVFTSGGVLNVRVVYDEIGKRPSLPRVPERLDVSLIAEPKPFRGPAGAAIDVCPKMDVNGTVLILEGARFASGSLLPMFLAHCDSAAQVTVGRNSDETPAGVYLVRREMMNSIPDMGFFDLKEQWLGRLLELKKDVRVFDLEQSGTYLLRTREQFLRAMQVAVENRSAAQFGRLPGGVVVAVGEAGGAVNLRPRIVAEGARVADDAVILDSIILDGAVVEAGAVVARSVVCSGAIIRAGTTVVDAVVGMSGSGSVRRGSR